MHTELSWLLPDRVYDRTKGLRRRPNRRHKFCKAHQTHHVHLPNQSRHVPDLNP